MKKTLWVACIAGVTLFGCKKEDKNNAASTTEDFKTVEQKTLNDFTDIVAVQQYADLAMKADALNATVNILSGNATEVNLNNARAAWVDMRAVWEQCEGFLFGPVDEDSYDPSMDTWPTDFRQMDSLMNTATPLSQSTLQNITLSLRGFHPLEYILFGEEGSRTAASISPRQKEYMINLAEDLQTNCHALSNSWSPNGGNFAGLVKSAGYGSTKYTSRREVFLAIADGLTGICEEVGTGKMLDPMGANVSEANPALVESPYSGNSATDFRNNIIGLENVYLSRYGSKDGMGLSDVVKANNQALDNKIRTQISAAINSFNAITVKYELAIFTQRTQIQNVQIALANLQTTLDGELHSYINQYIKD